jgi:hypothetical protein
MTRRSPRWGRLTAEAEAEAAAAAAAGIRCRDRRRVRLRRRRRLRDRESRHRLGLRSRVAAPGAGIWGRAERCLFGGTGLAPPPARAGRPPARRWRPPPDLAPKARALPSPRHPRPAQVARRSSAVQPLSAAAVQAEMAAPAKAARRSTTKAPASLDRAPAAARARPRDGGGRLAVAALAVAVLRSHRGR